MSQKIVRKVVCITLSSSLILTNLAGAQTLGASSGGITNGLSTTLSNSLSNADAAGTTTIGTADSNANLNSPTSIRGVGQKASIQEQKD